MAFYDFNQNSPDGARLNSRLTAFERAYNDIVAEFRTMEQKLSGDGGKDGDYDVITSHYGFVDGSGASSTAVAHGAFGVLASGVGKIDTDAPVNTVKSALRNMFMNMRN